MTFEDAIRELDLRHPMTERRVLPSELVNILKEDVVLTVERPGSWEGTNMYEVLRCHGYFIRE